MARGRGGRVIVGGGRPRRPMDWECGDLDEAVAADTRVCRWLIPPSVLREGYTDPTLMSTMVWGMVQHTTTGPDVISVAALGIIVVSAFDDADPVAAACPGPITDCDADWVYLFFAPTAVQSASVVTTSIGNSELDRRSQAKRRLGNDKAILMVAEALNDDYAAHMHVRCLIKE